MDSVLCDWRVDIHCRSVFSESVHRDKDQIFVVLTGGAYPALSIVSSNIFGLSMLSLAQD